MPPKRNGRRQEPPSPVPERELPLAPPIVDVMRDLALLAQRLESFTQHTKYHPLEADDEVASKLLPLARIVKATAGAMLLDDLAALDALSKLARSYLEERTWQSVPFGRFEPPGMRGAMFALGDVVTEKGARAPNKRRDERRGRALDLRVHLNTLESMVAPPAPETLEEGRGKPPRSVAELFARDNRPMGAKVANHMAMAVTCGRGALVDFLAEQGIRVDAADATAFDVLVRRLQKVVDARVFQYVRDDRFDGDVKKYRPREVARRVVLEALVELGACREDADSLLRSDDS
jgi:hypothetical protein